MYISPTFFPSTLPYAFIAPCISTGNSTKVFLIGPFHCFIVAPIWLLIRRVRAGCLLPCPAIAAYRI